jgi:subtilase family serine protease
MAVAMPGNPNYRRFPSIAELASKYGASAATMRGVVSGIAKTGLSAVVDPSQLFARVSGTAAQWSSALQTPLTEQPATANSPFDVYSFPKQLPAALQPNGTNWLFDQATVYEPSMDGNRPTTAPVHRSNGRSTTSPAATPWPTNAGTISGNVCQQQAVTAREVYTPAQVTQAYGAGGLAAAAGSTTPEISVIDLGGGWNAQDLAAAGSCFGYGSVHVDQEQGDGVASPIANADPETALDLQTVAAVAPKASIRLIQVSNGPAAMLDGFSRALADPHGVPDAISLSYGGCALADTAIASTFVNVTDNVLAMIAMSGASTFIAAGDSGSTTCTSIDFAPTLSYPAVSPFVTAVGGTRLTLTASNQRAAEVVWNDTAYGQKAAGGGGLARRESTPAYQNAANQSGQRAIPDVSALADIVPGWPVFLGGTLMPVGGTSGSTPFTAAATALVDAQLRSGHQPRVGLANGWFYQAARHNPGSFFDVTQGNNEINPVNCCMATTGYDPASGLGVPNWSTLPGTVPPPQK